MCVFCVLCVRGLCCGCVCFVHVVCVVCVLYVFCVCMLCVHVLCTCVVSGVYTRIPKKYFLKFCSNFCQFFKNFWIFLNVSGNIFLDHAVCCVRSVGSVVYAVCFGVACVCCVCCVCMLWCMCVVYVFCFCLVCVRVVSWFVCRHHTYPKKCFPELFDSSWKFITIFEKV